MKRIRTVIVAILIGLSVCLETIGATFSSLGHPKANGLDLQFTYPDEWSTQEGIRPHVVQLFKNKSKTQYCVLLIIDVNTKYTNKDWGEAFADVNNSWVNDFIGIGDIFSNVTTVHTKYEALNGIMVDSDVKLERAGITKYSKANMHIFGYKNNLIMLQCYATGDTEYKAHKAYEDSRNIFLSIANSMILMNIYKDF